MPLPLIPILWGVAALSTAYSAKKGLDGVESRDKAEKIKNSAEARFKNSLKNFERQKEVFMSAVEDYNRFRKIEIRQTFQKFLQKMKEIKKNNFKDDIKDIEIFLSQTEITNIHNISNHSVSIDEYVGGKSVAAVGSAAVAGVKLSMMAANPGFLTSIGARFGLAPSFMGVAGLSTSAVVGTATGVALPAALTMFASKYAADGEKQLTQAERYSSDVEKEIGKIKGVIIHFNIAKDRLNELTSIITSMDKKVNDEIKFLSATSETSFISVTVNLVNTLKLLLSIEPFDQSGNFSKKAQEAIKQYKGVC